MNAESGAGTYSVLIQFHGDLPFFFPRSAREQPLRRTLSEKTSIKDVVEACGVPHTEVDLLLCDGEPVGFAHQLKQDATIQAYPVGCAPDLYASERLQLRRVTGFVADGHLGKLVRDLRLLGLDVAYASTVADEELIAVSLAQKRALITLDRRLLMHSAVQHGYSPRSQVSEEQTVEVLRRFDVRDLLNRYSRCLRCNAPLATVQKSAVMDQLEPLTRIYYHEFRKCDGCGAVYWPGSHFAKLQARIDRIKAAAG
ncbi:MAG: hypothetical protein H0W20_02455 [Chthoniobacterales bacterium]|nr:hypothetical protein [Chthoniobacterales bacterium]